MFILLQYLLPQFLLSRFMGWVARCSFKPYKTFMISHFIKKYHVDMSLALKEKVADYPHFNAFFTRALKPGVRPLDENAEAIVSPVDGKVSQAGRIEKDTLIQAKGSYYKLQDLVGSAAIAEAFQDGSFATLYLSPKDYHRVHQPFSGSLRETLYVPGKLFSVSPQAVEQIPGLFARNERLVCLFDTDLGPMAVIFIGAMLVGQIETVWGGVLERSKTPVARLYTDQEQPQLAKGEELGRFNMGSSVIILFPKDKLTWVEHFQEGAAVEMGQPIAKAKLN